MDSASADELAARRARNDREIARMRERVEEIQRKLTAMQADLDRIQRLTLMSRSVSGGRLEWSLTDPGE